MLRRAVHRQAVNLRALLDSLAVDFALSTKSRGVTFEVLAFADELDADPSLLRRVLVSLIEHAMRRAPDGTSVTLVASPRPGFVEFRIADEGFRLAPDTRQKELVPRAVGLPERGLGLTYCRLVAEAQGGRFWIGETATGGVVGVALPTAAVRSRPGPARTKSGTQLRAGNLGPEATPQTILVVDDEPLVRAFVSRALKDRGYGVIEADSAERAMERLMFRRQPLALLLSDVGLPGVSGADLVRQARLVKPGLPTLLISATPKQSLVRDGVIREGTDLLQKPFSIADLFAKLEKLLPQPSMNTSSRPVVR